METDFSGREFRLIEKSWTLHSETQNFGPLSAHVTSVTLHSPYSPQNLLPSTSHNPSFSHFPATQIPHAPQISPSAVPPAPHVSTHVVPRQIPLDPQINPSGAVTFLHTSTQT